MSPARAGFGRSDPFDADKTLDLTSQVASKKQMALTTTHESSAELYPAARWSGGIRMAFKFAVLPLIFYALVFVVFTFPAITRFPTHLFCDGGDGLQTAWDVWWVQKAVLDLHQLPWYTRYLHFPYGTTLIAQTLNPFNGFAFGIPLVPRLGLVKTINIIVIFSFAFGATTAFWLTRYLIGNYLGSLISGFVFSFSNYHFAHAQGHLQLVSLEWIPVFLLAWMLLMEKPSIWRGIASGLSLFLVLLCDYYYFFYCVLAATFIVGWQIWQRRSLTSLVTRPFRNGLVGFLGVTLVTIGPFVVGLIGVSHGLIGAHDPLDHSLDLFGLIIPGGHWKFNQLTEFFWGRLPGNIHESSVHLGLAALLLIVLAWMRRKRIGLTNGNMLGALGVGFAVLAMGPRLQIFGRQIASVHLPYPLLELLFPPIKVSGVPLRMAVMVMLIAGIFVGAGATVLLRGSRAERLLGIGLLGVMLIEFLPKPIPTTMIGTPEWVKILREKPKAFGMIDVEEIVWPPALLYHQTIHQTPIALGYVTRIPESVHRADLVLWEFVQARNFKALCEIYGLRYLLFSPKGALASQIPIRPVYQGAEEVLYDVGEIWRCKPG